MVSEDEAIAELHACCGFRGGGGFRVSGLGAFWAWACGGGGGAGFWFRLRGFEFRAEGGLGRLGFGSGVELQGKWCISQHKTTGALHKVVLNLKCSARRSVGCGSLLIFGFMLLTCSAARPATPAPVPGPFLISWVILGATGGVRLQCDDRILLANVSKSSNTATTPEAETTATSTTELQQYQYLEQQRDCSGASRHSMSLCLDGNFGRFGPDIPPCQILQLHCHTLTPGTTEVSA